ncbi:unnamed protein product [Closterium sp. Yama58-4]|nr:unnamed protein product [Closterium sp. Yama58-4]
MLFLSSRTICPPFLVALAISPPSPWRSLAPLPPRRTHYLPSRPGTLAIPPLPFALAISHPPPPRARYTPSSPALPSSSLSRPVSRRSRFLPPSPVDLAFSPSLPSISLFPPLSRRARFPPPLSRRSRFSPPPLPLISLFPPLSRRSRFLPPSPVDLAFSPPLPSISLSPPPLPSITLPPPPSPVDLGFFFPSPVDIGFFLPLRRCLPSPVALAVSLTISPPFPSRASNAPVTAIALLSLPRLSSFRRHRRRLPSLLRHFVRHPHALASGQPGHTFFLTPTSPYLSLSPSLPLVASQFLSSPPSLSFRLTLSFFSFLLK